MSPIRRRRPRSRPTPGRADALELAADAGRPLPWTTDDPTVALLRAAAKLTIDHPDATSSAAAGLIDRLTPR